MRLTQHPMWPQLCRYLAVEIYDRDGGHKNPRHRFELRFVPPALVRPFLALRIHCATCGQWICPIRARHGGGSLFLAVSCPLARRIGCARSPHAAAEYQHVLETLQSERP